MQKYVKVKVENGYYIFKLRNLLLEKNISINKLMRETDTDYKVIRRLMNGESTKIDIFVISRFCNYLNCEVKDIIEYVKE